MTQQLNKKGIKFTAMFPLRSWDSKLKFSFLFLKAKGSFPKIWSKNKFISCQIKKYDSSKKKLPVGILRSPEDYPQSIEGTKGVLQPSVQGQMQMTWSLLANPAQWTFRMGTGPSNPTEILKWRTIRCYWRCFCSGVSLPEEHFPQNAEGEANRNLCLWHFGELTLTFCSNI